MLTYDNLTAEQERLYNALSDMHNNLEYKYLIKSAEDQNIEAVLGLQFESGSNKLSLLSYSINNNSTLHYSYLRNPLKNKPEVLKNFFTAPSEVTVNNQKISLSLLDYAVIFKQDNAIVSLILYDAKEANIDLKDLTTQKIGEIDPNMSDEEFIALIQQKMKEAGLEVPAQQNQTPVTGSQASLPLS